MGLEWWQIVLGVVVGLLLLIILVIIHELGHAIAAIRNGVEVEEFGLGFPPRAKILKKLRYKFRGENRETLITLNWLLPLGGFCKMKGESDDAKGKGTYGAASFWSKTKILFAGVFMNLIAAIVIFTILAWTGLPKISADQFALASDNHGNPGTVAIYSVVKDSPADQAGLKKGDEIREVAGHHIEMTAQVSDLSREFSGRTIAVDIVRDGKPLTATVKLNSDNDGGKGYLGVATQQKTAATIRATWSAPLVGVVDTFQFIWITLVGLAGLIGNLVQGLVGLVIQSPGAAAEISAAGDSVAGPVGILGVIFPGALASGATQLFFLMGVISLTLTVMNILPIPGLDGGRWYLTAWYRARRKTLTKEKEESVVGTGMLILFGLIILITVADIWKLF